MECNCTLETAYALKDICTDLSYNDSAVEFCYPEKLRDGNLSTLAGIWCLINAVVGLSGNMMTLFAIPYAAKRKKFNLHLHWTTTIFILNLAFADSLYCAINLPLYAMQYLKMRWIWGPDLCYITTAFRYVNAFADWMSVAMIAVSRCISLTRPELAEKLFGGRKGKLIILAIWVYANCLILPIYTKVSPGVCISVSKGMCNVVYSETIGDFGYNCLIGKCDFMHINGSNTYPRQVLYGIGFAVPCFATTFSYLVIWFYMYSNNKYLKTVGHSDLKEMITKREMKTTWTLFMVCICYFIFVMPITLVNVVNVQLDEPKLHLALFCIYWLQYSLNFFIYAGRSEQYRKAYSYFIHKMRACICDRQENSTTTAALFYVDRNMLPAILKNYAGAQLPREVAFPLNSLNFSNISLYGSNDELASSAVIIVARHERGHRRRASEVYRDKLFEWTLSRNHHQPKDFMMKVIKDGASMTILEDFTAMPKRIKRSRRASV